MNGKTFTPISTMCIVLFLSLLTFPILAQSPNISFTNLETQVEEDANVRLQAWEIAISQELPVVIRINDTALIEAKGVENGKVVYTVITNFQNPFENGYTAFYPEIEGTFDLSEADINHGSGLVTYKPATAAYISDNMAADGLLLVPESTGDRVMAFDRLTGAIVDLDFVPADPDNLSTPIEALPDLSNVGDIYLSDQVDDVVQRYDEDGVYIGVFAPIGGADNAILDNIRGTEFSPDGNLLVSLANGTNADAIAEFAPDGTYLGNLIANGAGGLDSPFDVLYWETDNSYVIPGITSDDIKKYDIDGNFVEDLLVDVPFAEQITELPDGRLAIANFTAIAGVDVIILATDGSIDVEVSSAAFGGLRGVYLLGDGNLMITNSGGVHKIDLQGNTVETIITGVSARFIHEYGVPAVMGECVLTCPGDIFRNLGTGECDAVVSYEVTLEGGCAGATLTQTEGLESGSTFPIGTTTNSFELLDAAGALVASCSFDVIVNEFPNQSTSLTCNDLVNVSLDASCEALINTDLLLEGSNYGCFDDFLVTVAGVGEGMGGVIISETGLFEVMITDPETNNSCWGNVMVEDKLPPVLNCVGCTSDSLTFALENTDPIWNRPFVNGAACNPSGVGTNCFYDAFQFTITQEDTYSFVGNGPFDGIGVLYSGEFDPENPCMNLIAYDDIVGPGLNPQIDITLDMAPGDYTLVMTSFDNGETGAYTWSISSLAGGQIQAQAACQYSCSDVTDILNGTIQLPFPTVMDDCGATFTFVDNVTDDCNPVFTRIYTATDAAGNTSSCELQFDLLVPTVDDIVVENYEGTCGESIAPSNTGYPTFNGTEISEDNVYCNIFFSFEDKPIDDCGNSSKIIRRWHILDWCNQESIIIPQIIKLVDTVGPVMTCPNDIEVGTDFWFCHANVSVQPPAAVDACGEVVAYDLASDAGVVVNFGNNYVINELPLGDNVITWTATDDCGNTSTCTFIITVVDDVAPVPNCDFHTIVSLTNEFSPVDGGPDGGLTLVPATVFDDGSYDNCSDVTFRARRMSSCIDVDWTTNGGCIDDEPNGTVNSRDQGTVHRPCVPFACCDVAAGPIMVELEVTDEAGNVNFCMVEVQVQDKLAPIVDCLPDVIVSCDFWFDDNVVENQFVPAETAGLEVFGRMLDAFDFGENQAARQPIIINDPGRPTNPNDPDFLPQPFNWGLDGWANDNCDLDIEVRVRMWNDCTGDGLPSGAPDNAVRAIERTFRATDAQGNITTCRQLIWVVDFDPFFITDETCNNANPNDGVIWPCDMEINECVDSIPVTPPTLFDDNCSQIAATYKDTRFDFVDGACFKVLREWTVIDWCQYNNDVTGGAEGIWKYTQVIKVIDQDGPEFIDCPEGPVTLCVLDEGVSLPENNVVFLGSENPNASTCSVHLTETKTVEEFCSDFIIYDVKVYPFNGADFIQLKNKTQVDIAEDGTASMTYDTRTAPNLSIRNNGLPYNSPFCGDYHRILWTVEDGCGNISTCEYLVRLEDCKQPTPVCLNGISTVVMPSNGSVTIWAKEYNISSIDDCTPADELLFSFSGENYQPSMEYNCDNTLAFGAELETNIYVADGGVDHNCNGTIEWSERNIDFCTTTIVITDNDNVCVGTGTITTNGDIMVPSLNEGVDVTQVTAEVPGDVFSKVAMTNDEGEYDLILPFDKDFVISAERNDDHKNGVSTLDLVRIQKHLLGVQPFDNPYDYIAADANNSEDLSALDLVEIRKLILGLYTEFPNNQSWRFVDGNSEFSDPSNPWPFDEVANIEASTPGNAFERDFEAVKVGDVNNSVVANATQIVTRNAREVIDLMVDDRQVAAGEEVTVQFDLKDGESLLGYQFTMNAQGLSLKDVNAGAADMTDQNIGLIDGQITISWHNLKGSGNAEDGLFTLVFEASQNGVLSEMLNINSDVTEAEAYDASESMMDVKLAFRGADVADFGLFQNEPNPFSDQTFISFTLPEASAATMTIFDVTGKVVHVVNGDYAAGMNKVEVTRSEIAATGMLYYRLEAGKYAATKKMIIFSK